MGFRFENSGAAATWAGGTSQQGQLTALAALWAGQVAVRYYTSGGTHLATVTHEAWIIDTATTPRSLKLGAWVAESHFSGGTAAYCVCAVPSGDDILRADVALAGAISDPGGRVRLDIGATLRIEATAGLDAVAIPAWRADMTAEDTLYYVGSQGASSAPSLTVPTRFGPTGIGQYGAGWDVITGYSSGTLLEDVGGAFGTMVYGAGGHKIISNQLLSVNLSEDDPTWSWWQQPSYKTSDTGGANLYYDPTEEAVIVAGPRGTAARIRPNFENTDAPLWDRLFPVAFNGWIFARKMTTGQMGDNAPHGYRYTNPAYIPASVTGTDSMFLVTCGPQGPFDQSYLPATVSDADWMDASVLSGGERRWPFYLRNIATGAWAEYQWQPDGVRKNSFAGPAIAAFPDTKHVYICTGIAVTGSGYWTLDFSAGTGTPSVGSFVARSYQFHRYSGGAGSVGDPLGRHFIAGPSGDHENRLTVYDFDAGTAFQIDLSAAGFVTDLGGDERIGTSYDPANQRLIILMAPSGAENAPYYWNITIPSTLTDSAGWVATKRFLSFSDSAIQSTIFQAGQSNQDKLPGFYNKTRIHPTLGCILIPSGDYRMVGFVPSA